MRKLFAAAAVIGTALASPAFAVAVVTAGATEGSQTDLFNGATVTATSPLLSGFSANDAFGAVTPAPDFPPETTTGGHTIFADGSATQFINFNTAAPVTIAGFVASISSDGPGSSDRGFTSISLFGSSDGGMNYTQIDSTAIVPTLGGQTVTFSFAPVTGQFFRFEGTPSSNGSRILELDAVGIAAVPEPATWAMMIGGFGMLGGTLRRRQGRAALAA